LEFSGITCLETSRDLPDLPRKGSNRLVILDRGGAALYRASYPWQVYSNFESIPPLIVYTLLFIESREMLDSSRPFRNPAIQWGRLSRAVVDLAMHRVDHSHQLIGGSTLATQLEKIRHSPGGRTGSVVEKARQMASASLFAYQDGPETLQTQRDIICDYINSIPMAATGGEGEVIGLADGLRDWY
jgi:membrane peptidoglycan carboxypeptidase